MSHTYRDRYRMRDVDDQRDYNDQFERQDFSRNYERDRRRSERGFRADDDRGRSPDNSDDADGYLPSGRPYEGLVGELAGFNYDKRGQHYGRGPLGYTRSDDLIYDDINDHLTQHSYIDATEITVKVDKGEVTLEGFVPDRDQRRYAEDVAEEVHGVNNVTNLLKVRKPQSDLVQNTTGKQ